MARRPLPRILTSGSVPIARGREIVRTAADNATDVLHPLITIGRGLRKLAAAGRAKWAATPKERRGPTLLVAAACVMAVALMPYGPLLALIAVMAAAAWKGRERPVVKTGPDEAETERLKALYEALVPYFSVPEDPCPLYAHGGAWNAVFSDFAFDDGRLARLHIAYPAYFPDGDPGSRARIEQLLHAKSGRGREYRFDWDEEGNRLTVRVLPALPASIVAQRFVTVPGETVLGFTDEDAVQRTVPVRDGDGSRDAPPVVWRTGPRSTEPHLLAVGQPGSGTSTLLRSVALQALQHAGDVLVVEGCGTGEYACLAGRHGVVGVECGLPGALAALEWAAHETERRLTVAHRAREAGEPVPAEVRRPLWILLDRPTALGDLAASEGRPDPQELLAVPLRHGRAANVTVVVAEQFDTVDALSDTVRSQTRARVALGDAAPHQLAAVLGAPAHTTPPPHVPPGRGYARLGAGPVLRLQVPATPDPHDDATVDSHRRAVLDLLPERHTEGRLHVVPPSLPPADETASDAPAPAPAAEGAAPGPPAHEAPTSGVPVRGEPAHDGGERGPRCPSAPRRRPAA
ncbi:MULTISPECIES: hypothetical protein [unclassified Streptomyces]|uniref:hypothetical protein n=1 Tax=unclassified Streptomyces TaxID=2593676 RepID=UPI0009A0AE15|nr:MULTISPECIES: hypothetical protein [unclassified Streptomyces]